MTDVGALQDSYLQLMERCLLGLIWEDPPQDIWSGGAFKPALRETGRDWPSKAHSMIGSRRMRNIRLLAEDVVRRGVPGDFIETGIWRGGACIMMRAVLKAHGVTDRRVWCADSFEGLPDPDAASYPQDANDQHATYEALAISLEQVQENFSRYDLLDDQVRFLKGWFKDTLPTAPIETLAILRLDGDMYQSTMEAFEALYDKLSPGGYCIIDDMGAVPACRQAVADFRNKRGITDRIEQIDWTGAYWRKS